MYQAFDVLWLDGRSLMDRPLWQRKNRLHEIITPSAEFAAVDFVDDEGIAFFDAVCERKLEGIVAKQKDSLHAGRPSKSWLEIRALQSGDFVVGGYTFGGARRQGRAVQPAAARRLRAGALRVRRRSQRRPQRRGSARPGRAARAAATMSSRRSTTRRSSRG